MNFFCVFKDTIVFIFNVHSEIITKSLFYLNFFAFKTTISYNLHF